MRKKTTLVMPYSGMNLRSMTCCNLFFPCEETVTADGYMTDVVGGIQYAPYLGNRDNGYGSQITNWHLENGNTTVTTVYPTLYSTTTQPQSPHFSDGYGPAKCPVGFVPLKSGVFPAYGTKSVLYVAVARVGSFTGTDSVSGTVGDGSNLSETFHIPIGYIQAPPVFGPSWGGGTMHSNYVCANGVGASTSDVLGDRRLLTVGQDVVIIMRIDRVGLTLDFEVYKTDGTLATDPDNGHTLSQTANIDPTATTCNPGSLFTRIGGFMFYGIATYLFTDGIPSDWKTGCMWMMGEWMRKSTGRGLYPGWRDLT